MAANKKQSAASSDAAKLVEAFIEGRKSLRRFTTTEAAVEAFKENAMQIIMSDATTVDVPPRGEGE